MTSSYKLKKRNASERGKEFDLTIDDWNLLQKTTHCDYTGIRLTDDNRSVERLDNNKGYVRGNVLMTANTANMSKNNLSDYELLTKGSFETARERLGHLVVVVERIRANRSQREIAAAKLTVSRRDLNTLLQAPEVIDVEGIVALAKKITNVSAEVSRLDEDMIGLQKACVHVTNLNKSLNAVVIMARVHEAIHSGEAQRKANAYFGIDDKEKAPRGRFFSSIWEKIKFPAGAGFPQMLRLFQLQRS